MAKVEVTYKVVETPIDTVHLELSPKEAEFLVAVLGTGIIGSGELRDISETLYYDLLDAGIHNSYSFTDRLDVRKLAFPESEGC